ncbi:MAG: ATP-binding protein [Chloroflexi bacterium]|nr:ATP-binding protein [Chloroflexota bacterium]
MITPSIATDDRNNKLLRYYISFFGITWLLIVSSGYWLFRTNWRQVTYDQQLLTASLNTSEMPSELLQQYLVVEATGREIDIAGNQQNKVTSSGLWRRWIQRVTREAWQHADTPFTTEDPDGVLWLHTGKMTSSNSVIVLQRPVRSALTPFFLVGFVVIVSELLLLAAPLVVWWAFMRNLIVPLRSLTDISEVIRWRGYLHYTERDTLEQIITHKNQTSSLAHALLTMESEITRRFVQLSTLLYTSHIVVSSLKTDEVLDNILSQVQELFHCDRCAILTLDERLGAFRVRASRGLSQYYVEHLIIAPTQPNSPTMRALRNKIPIQVVDIETDLAYREFRERARVEQFRSYIAVPLETQYTSPSILLLYRDIPYHYSSSERELVISFGNYASLALENATLYARSDKQLQLQTQRLESIVESLTEALILEGETPDIIYVNTQARRLFGLSDHEIRREALQSAIDRILSTTVETESSYQAYQNAYRQVGDCTIDIMRRMSNRQSQDLRIHFFDVTDTDQQHLGRGQLWQDITQDKQVERMKSSLISTVSHEFRTPLAAIKGYVTTLLAQDVTWDIESQRRFLNTISVETDRLAHLVSNLLDLSQIEARLLKIRREPASLNELIIHIVDGLPLEVRRSINLHLSDPLPVVLMDASRIETVIRNLIDNAVKYAPQSPIDIATDHTADTIMLSVRDYGGGISVTEQKRVFEPFYRVDNRLSRDSGGFGLGLSICQGFIEAHQGIIWVENMKPGLKVSFSLPGERLDRN